jgi:hypothetical protein
MPKKRVLHAENAVFHAQNRYVSLRNTVCYMPQNGELHAEKTGCFMAEKMVLLHGERYVTRTATSVFHGGNGVFQA